MHHQNGTMASEVGRGKRYFPEWNVARWWLSDEGFQRQPDAFVANFDAGLAIFAAREIAVVPVLFNRWRDPLCDFGGVSLDHIIPEVSNRIKRGNRSSSSTARCWSLTASSGCTSSTSAGSSADLPMTAGYSRGTCAMSRSWDHTSRMRKVQSGEGSCSGSPGATRSASACETAAHCSEIFRT